jgi:hypothetical protein
VIERELTMAGSGTVRRERFAGALAQGASIAEAARKASVAERTARRWWSEPDSRSAVARLQAEGVEASAARLGALNAKALDVLDAALDDTRLSPSHYRRARLALGLLAEYRARRETERLAVLERLEADVAELRAAGRRPLRALSGSRNQ